VLVQSRDRRRVIEVVAVEHGKGTVEVRACRAYGVGGAALALLSDTRHRYTPVAVTEVPANGRCLVTNDHE
jgi:hypothetical protein